MIGVSLFVRPQRSHALRSPCRQRANARCNVSVSPSRWAIHRQSKPAQAVPERAVRLVSRCRGESRRGTPWAPGRRRFMDLATAGTTDMGATLGSLKPLLDTPVSALRGNHTDPARQGAAISGKRGRCGSNVTCKYLPFNATYILWRSQTANDVHTNRHDHTYRSSTALIRRRQAHTRGIQPDGIFTVDHRRTLSGVLG